MQVGEHQTLTIILDGELIPTLTLGELQTLTLTLTLIQTLLQTIMLGEQLKIMLILTTHGVHKILTIMLGEQMSIQIQIQTQIIHGV